MTIVAEISWNDILDGKTLPETPARTAWREAVAEIADKARTKLPECSGRVDSAVKIVLAGDVELLADGTAKVASQSNGTTVYHVANGECSCKDFAKAPHSFCKHRLGAAIARRAHELVKAKLNGASNAAPAPVPHAPPQEPVALPEAPASVNCHITLEGRQVQVTLRDTDETRLLERLGALLRHYPVTETQPAYPDPQRLSGRLVCPPWRTDDAEPQKRSLLVVPSLGRWHLVQGQVGRSGWGRFSLPCPS